MVLLWPEGGVPGMTGSGQPGRSRWESRERRRESTEARSTLRQKASLCMIRWLGPRLEGDRKREWTEASRAG